MFPLITTYFAINTIEWFKDSNKEIKEEKEKERKEKENKQKVSGFETTKVKVTSKLDTTSSSFISTQPLKKENRLNG